MNGYDENGKVLIASKEEIEEAKYRVKLKREIRKKGNYPYFMYSLINNFSTSKLEIILETL